MVPVRHTQSGKAPSVLQVGIERKAILFDRQRGAARMNVHRPREVMTQSVLETRSPTWRPGREPRQGKKVGSIAETGIERATAIKADPLGIEFIKIMKYAAGGKTFVVIQWMLEETDGTAGAAEH